MADTSNNFSLNGLNRQKILSGLHARRPENLAQYFDSKVVPLPPTFVSILSIDVVSAGSNYSNNLQIIFPQPEHPQGTRAAGEVYLDFSKYNFQIIDTGSNYSVDDYFNITSPNETSPVGGFIVTEVDDNGSIVDFDIINLIPIKSGSSFFVDLNGTNASISIRMDQGYSVNYINMTNYGSGYQTYNRVSGGTIEHNPTVYNTTYSYDNQTQYYLESSGYGLRVKSNKSPYIKLLTAPTNRSRQFYTDKYQNVSFSPDYANSYYMLINNYSLSDPTR